MQLKGRKQGYSHFMCQLNLKNIFLNFEIITASLEVANIIQGGPENVHLVFSSGNILHNYDTTSITGNQH